MESKNDDPNGCPDRVLGECEAICAVCQRDMHPELERLRDENERECQRGNDLARQLNAAEARLVELEAGRSVERDMLRVAALRIQELERRDTAAVEQAWVGDGFWAPGTELRKALDELVRARREGEQ